MANKPAEPKRASWWERHAVPRLIRFACGAPQVMKRRAAIVPLARGAVFELGCGGGLNQQFYDAHGVTRFAGVDPNGKLREYAAAEARARGWDADIRGGVGEAIPFPDESFDTVVSTFTLCSVRDQQQVLRETRRILRPGGALLFLEHGAAPDPGVARWQKRIEPVWKPLAGGCHLTRPIAAAVEEGGFAVDRIGEGYAPATPRPLGWMEWGIGRKKGA